MNDNRNSQPSVSPRSNGRPWGNVRPGRQDQPDIIDVLNVELYRYVNGGTRRTNVLEFPGCFHLDMKVNVTRPPETNLILFESFKWHQSGGKKQLLEFGCQNPDAYGCGGIGNRCYYCDVCNNIQDLNKDFPSNNKLNFECPKRQGIYNLRESHCINSWGRLDEDKDGDPDFLQDDKFEDYKKLLEGLRTSGLGEMSLQIVVATNATYEQKKAMRDHRNILKGSFRNEQLLESKWADTHRRFWLPKLVSDNKKICVEIYFNVCEHRDLTDAELDGYECN